jgi:hypothetical protein
VRRREFLGALGGAVALPLAARAQQQGKLPAIRDARALAVVFGRIGNVGAEGLQEDRNDSRIVHVERMHLPDPTPGNHIEACFDADGTGTLMTMRMTLLDAATRAKMLRPASSAAWKRASSGLRP